MCMFELQDLLFAIKTTTSWFNIQDYINFSSASSRSSACNKLVIPRHPENIFLDIPTFIDCQLLNLDLPFRLLKYKLKVFLWDHFTTNFNDI